MCFIKVWWFREAWQDQLKARLQTDIAVPIAREKFVTGAGHVTEISNCKLKFIDGELVLRIKNPWKIHTDVTSFVDQEVERISWERWVAVYHIYNL